MADEFINQVLEADPASPFVPDQGPNNFFNPSPGFGSSQIPGDDKQEHLMINDVHSIVNNTVKRYKTLRTDKVIRYHELDQGFILRANPELTVLLRNLLQKGSGEDDDEQNDQNEEAPKEKGENDLEILNLDRQKRLFGVKVENKLFFATLVDLPCIIEAMKTLDYFNFYKSQDASQILYVHPISIEDLTKISADELELKIKAFDAVKDDPDFFNQLYDRTGLKKQIEDAHKAEGEGDKATQSETLRLRHGVSPVTKNVINTRYKKKPNFEIEKVKKVEGILKSMIDYGFFDHVTERLLEFDEEGVLKKVTEANNDKKGATRLDLEESKAGSIHSSDDGMSSMTGGLTRSMFKQSMYKSELNADSASVSNFRQPIKHKSGKKSEKKLKQDDPMALGSLPFPAEIMEEGSQSGSSLFNKEGGEAESIKSLNVSMASISLKSDSEATQEQPGEVKQAEGFSKKVGGTAEEVVIRHEILRLTRECSEMKTLLGRYRNKMQKPQIQENPELMAELVAEMRHNKEYMKSLQAKITLLKKRL